MSNSCMNSVSVKLLKEEFMADFYFGEDQSKTALRLLKEDNYRPSRELFSTILEDEKAAEELFDMTNNPSRHGEKLTFYGTGRSVSIGDIVSVNGINYLCASFGWKQLEAA